jgi:hypothetical protein
VKTDTNKRLLISESHGDSNRCTPYRGKPDQHATYASHSSPRTSGICFLRAVPVRDNLSLAPTKSKHAPTPGESLGNQRQTARPSSWVTSFVLPCDSPEVGERGFGPMVTQLHQFAGPISPAYIWYVQYLLTGPTEWSLTDTGGGYNLGGADLPHTHSPTFPASYPHFPLMAPLGLQFNQVLAINQSLSIKEPTAATWSFDHSAIYRRLYLRLAITNDISLVVGSQG